MDDKTEAEMKRFVWRMAIADEANRTAALMDGTTKPVKKLLADYELVFGVWNGEDEESGVGIMLMKGMKRMEALAAAAEPAPEGAIRPNLKGANWTAVKCAAMEQAAACREMFGDGTKGDPKRELPGRIFF